jgi:uncharacterized protein YecT (DUF1311 family)
LNAARQAPSGGAWRANYSSNGHPKLRRASSSLRARFAQEGFMRRIRFLIGFSIGCSALGLAGAATAQETPVQETPAINCKEATTEIDKTICASSELKAMDREIAALYDEARSDADPSEREAILNDQRAFLDQREACVAKLNSAHPGVATYECIRNTMARRAKVLQGEAQD